MNAKSVEMAILFDFYGEILTEKQREIFDLYYNEDFSLAEIAEHLSISRQGVRDAVVRVEEVLVNMENTLKLAKKFGSVGSVISEICKAVEEIDRINEYSLQNRVITENLQKIFKATNRLSD